MVYQDSIIDFIKHLSYWQILELIDTPIICYIFPANLLLHLQNYFGCSLSRLTLSGNFGIIS